MRLPLYIATVPLLWWVTVAQRWCVKQCRDRYNCWHSDSCFCEDLDAQARDCFYACHSRVTLTCPGTDSSNLSTISFHFQASSSGSHPLTLLSSSAKTSTFITSATPLNSIPYQSSMISTVLVQISLPLTPLSDSTLTSVVTRVSDLRTSTITSAVVTSSPGITAVITVATNGQDNIPPTDSPVPIPANNLSDPKAERNKSKAGAIAGGIILGLSLLAILAALTHWGRRRKVTSYTRNIEEKEPPLAQQAPPAAPTARISISSDISYVSDRR